MCERGFRGRVRAALNFAGKHDMEIFLWREH